MINRLGEYLKPLADRWLVVGDKFVLGFAQSTVEKSFIDAGLVVEIAPFGGECSQNEIDRLRGIAETAQCGAILGIGGGKTLDTAKALAHFMGVPVAIAPTIASTDAPCSAAAERTGSRPAQHGGLQRIKGALRADDSGIKRSLPGASDGSAGNKDPSKEYGIL